MPPHVPHRLPGTAAHSTWCRPRGAVCLAVLFGCLCAAGSGCLRTPVGVVFPLPVSADEARRSCRQIVGHRGAPAAAAISWLIAEENLDRADAPRWCGTVGPAVIAPLPPPALPVPVDQIAMLSWNMHVGGGDLAGLIADLRAGRLTDGRPVAHFVLLIQEALRMDGSVPRTVPEDAPVPSRVFARSPDGMRHTITDLASRLGATVYYVPSMRNGRTADTSDGEDRGNAILSTLPLSEFTAIELPLARQRRVAIAATIAGGSASAPWRIRVASAHLEASAGMARLRLFASGVRTRQARTLIAALEDDGPVVMGADLNTWADARNESAFLELRRAFPQTPSPGLRPTFRLGLMLDYLFFRLPEGWSGTARRIDSRFGSDHHPLLARLTQRVSAPAAWHLE